MSRKKAFAIQSIGSYINIIISITQGIILLPIYFNYVSHETYGMWLTISSVVVFVNILNFGVNNLSIQKMSYSYGENKINDFIEYFIANIFLNFIIAILIILLSIILFIFFLPIVSDKNNIGLDWCYIIAVAYNIISIFNCSLIGFNQALLKPIFGVISTIIGRIAGIILSVLLISITNNIISIPIGLFFTEFIILICNSINVIKNFNRLSASIIFNKDKVKEFINLSPSLFLLISGNKIINNIHPIIITTFLGPEYTTFYVISRKILDVLMQAVNIINSSIISPLSNLISKKDSDKINNTIRKLINYGLTFSIIAIFGYIYINANFIAIWIGGDFKIDSILIQFIGYSALFSIFSRLFRSILYSYSEFKYLSQIVFIEGIIYLTISIALLTKLGLYAIPIGVFISGFISNFFLLTKIKKIISFKVNIFNIHLIRFITYFIILGELNIDFHNENENYTFLLKSFLFLLVVLITESCFNYKFIIRLIKKRTKY